MLGALGTLDRKHVEIYLHLVFKALAGPMRQALQEELMLSEKFNDVELEGRAVFEILMRYRDQGEAQGQAKGQARALFKILDRAGITLSPEQRQTIERCEDPAQVDAWIDRAFDAKSAADVFG